jgi:hypothetical protein
MLEKFLSTSLLVLFLLIFIPILRYAYSVWFQGNEFIARIKENQPDWQRQSRFFSNLRESPYQLLISRIVITFVFFVSIPMFIVLLWVVLITWLK